MVGDLSICCIIFCLKYFLILKALITFFNEIRPLGWVTFQGHPSPWSTCHAPPPTAAVASMLSPHLPTRPDVRSGRSCSHDHQLRTAIK